MLGDRVGRSGTVIGERFRLDEMVGRGAMADVYRALDLTTQTSVALKILRFMHLADETSKARFAREGEAQARLRHPNVAELLATGVTTRLEPYLAVELLRGSSLRTVIKNEPRIEPARAVSYALQALNGLAAVHAAGIVHRDLKPANIMLEPSRGAFDRVVLIDFGFAAFEDDPDAARRPKLTLQGTVVGSLAYIAPERLRSEPADHRADLYAIGIILFELLVGRPPFASDNDVMLAELHINEEPPRLRELRPELPQALDDVIWRALAKEPDERYMTARAMALELERAAAAIAPRSA